MSSREEGFPNILFCEKFPLQGLSSHPESLLRPCLRTRVASSGSRGQGQFGSSTDLSPAGPAENSSGVAPRPSSSLCLFLSSWLGCSTLKVGLVCLGRGAEELAGWEPGRRRGRRIREGPPAFPVGATRVGLHYSSRHLSPVEGSVFCLSKLFPLRPCAKEICSLIAFSITSLARVLSEDLSAPLLTFCIAYQASPCVSVQADVLFPESLPCNSRVSLLSGLVAPAFWGNAGRLESLSCPPSLAAPSSLAILQCTLGTFPPLALNAPPPWILGFFLEFASQIDGGKDHCYEYVVIIYESRKSFPGQLLPHGLKLRKPPSLLLLLLLLFRVPYARDVTTEGLSSALLSAPSQPV